jgi:ribosomal protein S18 acetylase RimI-like enzyme
MTNARIEFETITRDTFDDLKSLVIEQARHHESAYAGDDAAFVQALGAANPVPQILMVRDDDTQEALGYILFNHYHGLKGEEFYIEDILVSGKRRSQGYGLAMIEVLKDKARELGVEKISWVVAQNNEAAIRFYENKVHAIPTTSSVYDAGHLFAAPPAASAACEVRRADAADLDLIESYVGQVPGLTADTVKHLRAAAAAPNAAVYLALDSEGVPKALGVANLNYSSFRTVTGLKVEIMELAGAPAEAGSAFAALTAHIVDEGKREGHTGHLTLYIDKASRAQNDFVKTLGSQPLAMTDDPSSVFCTYGIGRDIIYAPAPQNVINKNQPPAPKPD